MILSASHVIHSMLPSLYTTPSSTSSLPASLPTALLSTTPAPLTSLGLEEVLEEVRRKKHPVIYMHGKTSLSRLHQDEARRAEIRRRKWDLTRPTVV